MSELNMYRCTPREARKHIVTCIKSGRVPFVRSSPGVGKSALMRSVAKEFNLAMIDHRLSTSAPEDLSGLPEFYTDAAGVRRARFVPFEMFPVAGTPIPDGKDGWMLFLDEANSGTKMVQAASYKLVLDNMVGQLPLHQNVAITMAGNLETDRAIVTPLSTAMQSRVIHIEMYVDFMQWLEDVALAENYDDRIIAFLSWQKDYLMDFNPEHDEKTFCCPRTWEFMNSLIRNGEVTDEDTGLYAGTITSGVAAAFVQFCKVYHDIITIDDVMKSPLSAQVPRDAERKWAIVSNLMRETGEKEFPTVSQYINRYDISFKVLFYRGLLAQKPVLRTHPAFGPAMTEVTRWLSETGSSIA